MPSGAICSAQAAWPRRAATSSRLRRLKHLRCEFFTSRCRHQKWHCRQSQNLKPKTRAASCVQRIARAANDLLRVCHRHRRGRRHRVPDAPTQSQFNRIDALRLSNFTQEEILWRGDLTVILGRFVAAR